MDEILKIWDFLQSPTAVAIFAALFALSEALGAIPSVKANSVFQLVHGLLAKLAKKEVVPCLAMLALLRLF